MAVKPGQRPDHLHAVVHSSAAHADSQVRTLPQRFGNPFRATHTGTEIDENPRAVAVGRLDELGVINGAPVDAGNVVT